MTPFKTPDHATMHAAECYWQGVRDALRLVNRTVSEGLDCMWDSVPPSKRFDWLISVEPTDPEDWINHGGSI